MNCQCINLGCVEPCELIATGKNALSTSIKIDYLMPNGSVVRERIETSIGDEIKVPNRLNENGYQKFKVVNSGECYLFKVKVQTIATIEDCCD